MAIAFHHERIQRLRSESERWVAAGIISSAQAEAILQLEEVGAGTEASVEEKSPTLQDRLPLIAELLSYLGIILVSVSGALIVRRFWGELHVGGRLAVGFAVAAVGLLGGTLVMRISDPGARRLGAFLWLCGTGGVGLAVGVAADAAWNHDQNTTVLCAGLAVLGVSVALWRNLERPLQLLSTITGAAMAVVGFGLLVHLSLTALEVGVLVWCAAFILGLLAWRRVIHPELTALIVAEVGTLWAAVTMASSHAGIGLALGAATAAAGVGSGLALKRPPMVVVGVLGFLGFLGGILGRYLSGPAAALGVFLVGIVLVVAAIRYGVRRSRNAIQEPDHHEPQREGPSASA